MNEPRPSKCPPTEHLQEYATGQISDAQDQEITDHLQECPACEDTVDSLINSNDTLMQDLRRLSTLSPDVEAYQVDLDSLPPLASGVDLDATVEVRPADDATVNSNADLKQDPSALDRPSELGRYRLVRKLGQGGMGAVYEAIHTRLDKRVAVKVLPRDRFDSPRAIERFEREMKAIGRVQHPNVVVAHDGGEVDGQHFLVMEYVDGLDIATLLQQHGRLSTSVVCEIIRQAAVGLQHAHDMGLIHRDIKPSNIMLDRDGIAKLLDLGLARIDTAAPAGDSKTPPNALDSITDPGTVMGSIGFMSPEQALDSRTVDHRSDLYSLGVTLYLMLADRLPFPYEKYDTNGKMLVAIATETPPSIADCGRPLPDELVGLIDQLLIKDPADRLSSATQVATKLEPFSASSLKGLCDQNIPDEEGLMEPVAVTKSQSSRSITVWLGIALATIAFVIAGFAIFRVQTPTGTLLVEVVDDKAAALLTEKGIKVVDEKNDRVWNIQAVPKSPQTLPAGKYRFQAAAGLVITDESGVEIRSDELKLLDENKRLRLRVAIAATESDPSRLEISQPKVGVPASTDDDVYRWVKSIGGQAMTRSSTGRLKPADDTDSDLILSEISLTGKKQLRSGDLKRLAGLRGLERLKLNESFLDEEALDYIATLPNLNRLEIFDCGINSSQLSRLRGLKRLRSLLISKWQVDDDWKFLQELPQVNRLETGGSELEALKHPEYFRNIQQILVTDTEFFSEPVVRSLKSVNPALRILYFRFSGKAGGELIELYAGQDRPPRQRLADFINVQGGQVRCTEIAANGFPAYVALDQSQGPLVHLNINLIGQRSFGDDDLVELAKILRTLDLERCNLTLRLWETSITQYGLVALDGLSIGVLETVNTNLNLSRARQGILNLDVETWKLGGKVNASDIRLVGSMPSIKAMDIGIDVSDMSSSMAKLDAIANSRAIKVIVGSEGKPGPLGAGLLNILKTVKASNLDLGGFTDLNANTIDELQSALPLTNIWPVHQTGKSLVRSRLEGDGHHFTAWVDGIDQAPREYAVEFDALRTSKRRGGLGIVFRIGGHKCQAILGGWHGTITAFEAIDGRVGWDAKNMSKHVYDPFADGNRHRIRLEVRKNSIGVLVDGMYQLWWHGDPSSLSVLLNASQNLYGDVFFVAHDNAAFNVSNLSITPLAKEPDDPIDLYLPDREFAKQIWKVGGEVGPWHGTLKKEDIDKSEFRVTTTYLSNLRGPIPPDTFRSMARLPALRNVRLLNSQILETSLDAVNRLAFIQAIAAQRSDTLTSDFERLNDLRFLCEFECSASQVDDDWQFLQSLDSVRTLSIWGKEPPSLEALASFPQLNLLFLYDVKQLPNDLISKLQKVNPNLQIAGNVDGKMHALGEDPVVREAKKLGAKNWRISGHFFDLSLNWQAKDFPSNPQIAVAHQVRSPAGIQLTDQDFQSLAAIVRNVDSLTFSPGVTGLAPLPEFLAGRMVKRLIVSETEFDDSMLEQLAKFIVLDYLDVRDTPVTRQGVEAFKQAHPTCHVISSFGDYPTQHCMPGEATFADNRKPLNWQDANRVVKELGGLIRVGLWGSALPIGEHLESVPSDVLVHLTFRGVTEFSDTDAQRVAQAFEGMPAFTFATLDLDGTSITSQGLLEFEDLEPGFVVLANNQNGLDINPIGERLGRWKTGTWEFGEAIGSQGLTQFSKNSPSGTITVSATQVSPEALGSLNAELMTTLGIHFDGKSIDDYLPQFLKLTNLRHLHLFSCPKPTSQQLQSIRSSLPKATLYYNAKALELSGESNGEEKRPVTAVAPFDAAVASRLQIQWAKHLDTEVETTNSIGMKFRLIPPGEFTMGSSKEEVELLSSVFPQNSDGDWSRHQIAKEMPQVQVQLTQPFFMGMHEVTRGQFRQFVKATGYQTEAETDDIGGQGFTSEGQQIYSSKFSWKDEWRLNSRLTESHPVVNVSWNDAVAFCDWLSKKEGVLYRLPTEAQWEFACRAGSVDRYCSGDGIDELKKHAWLEGMEPSTSPVGKKLANSFGLFDLHGNVFEWCADIVGPYSTTPVSDPKGAPGPGWRVLRGGSFVGNELGARSAFRHDLEPRSRNDNLGFRVMRDVRSDVPVQPSVRSSQ